MARIPLTVAQPRLEREPGVSYPQGGGPIGAAVTEFGSAIADVAKALDVRKERQDIFDGNLREEEFNSRVALGEQDALANAPADGSDIVAGIYGEVDPVTGRVAKPGSFDQDFNEAAARMPASQRQQFLAKRELYRLKGQQRLTPIQIDRRRGWEGLETQKQIDKFINAIEQSDPNDPNVIADFKARGEAMIRARDMDALDEEKLVEAWNQNSEIALVKAQTRVDPSQVRALLGEPKPGEGGVSTGPLPADQSERAGRAMSFFTGRGYTKEQAAGIIGNLLSESGLRPSGAVGDAGTAFGMAQWRGERLTRLKRFANARGKSWEDFDTQLAFIDTELQTQETGAYQQLKAAKTVEEATAAFIGYERPRGWTADNPRGGHGWKSRLANAARVAGVELPPGTDIGPDIDPRFSSLTMEQRLALANAADAAVADQMAALRADLDVITTNAPVAIQNTGAYTGGPLPEQDDFIKAYGVDNGPEKYRTFQAQVETAKSVHAMQTMPADEIQSMLKASEAAIGSGDTAALGAAKHASLAAAAEQTLKARDTDPAGYVAKAFKSVEAKWIAAARAAPNQRPEAYRQVIAASIAAQQQLGILDQDIKPLIGSAATAAVESFNDEQIPLPQRIDAIASFVMTTMDPTQRQAIYEQLVEAGLPEATEPGFDAMARGDTGAARRLVTAAVTKVSELPGKIDATPAAIAEEIQTQWMDDGKPGDIYYGNSSGSAENFKKMSRGSQAMTNAVHINMRGGQDLQTAVKNAGLDVFGKVQVVKGNDVVNAEILIPEGDDPDAMLAGLENEQPKVRLALEAMAARNSHRLIQATSSATGFHAVIPVVTEAGINEIMATGSWRNAEVEGGFAFFDTNTGLPVVDEKGATIIFRPKVLTAAETEAWRAGRTTTRRILEEGARQGVYP